MEKMNAFDKKHVCGMSENGYALYRFFVKELCNIPEDRRHDNLYDVKEAFLRALDDVKLPIKEEVNRRSGMSMIGSDPKPNWYYSHEDDFAGFTSRLFCEL